MGPGQESDLGCACRVGRILLARGVLVNSVIIALLICFIGGAEVALAKNTPPRNLILITVDTLRADYLGAYGSERKLTPSLDAFAAKSLVFRETYTPTPFTLPAVTALFTGRLPEEYGILINDSSVPHGIPTLATVLKQRGFRTVAIVGNFVLRRGTGIDQGFEIYDDDFPQVESMRNLPERIATSTTRGASKQLRELVRGGDTRFFFWVHYQDPHGPYTPPRGYRERYLDAERNRPDGRRKLPLIEGKSEGVGALPQYQAIGDEREVAFFRAGYAGEVHFVDEQIGKLLGEIEVLGLMENSLIVFVADHGESLGENDYWFAHGSFLSDSLVKVPLIFYRPHGQPGERTDVAGLIDVFSTVLEQLKERPESSLPARGRDLFAPDAEKARPLIYMSTSSESKIRRVGLVAWEYKYIVNIREGPDSEELFRAGDAEHNRASTEPGMMSFMRNQLQVYRTGIEPIKTSSKSVSEAVRRQLRALGYVGGR